MNGWSKRFVTALAAMTAAVLSVGSAAGAAEQQQAGRNLDPDAVAAAAQVVLLPELGITHRLPAGGMNLWMMPLSEWEGTAAGKPVLRTTLDTGGFSYDRSTTVVGDFGDLTPGDDGTTDYLVWHSQPNGGVLLWAVGGGNDTKPRLLQDLRTGGWSYANSKPLAGDVTGDGVDDLVVIHRNSPPVPRTSAYNVWVFAGRNSGGLDAPVLWRQDVVGFDSRWMLGDVSGDGLADLVQVFPSRDRSVHYRGYYSLATRFDHGGLSGELVGGGWSYDRSRQMLGDVDGDGSSDLVHIHAQGNNPGMLVWVQRGRETSPDFGAPEVWQDLRSGGWSFEGSRQHLADTNGDFLDDLVSVHAQSGNPGELVWRHLSTGHGLRAPQVLADLCSGGWTYTTSREGVANLVAIAL